MRIVQLYKDYFPVLGGIENHLKLLAEGLANRGIEVTVLVTNRSLKSEEHFCERLRVIKASRLVTVASTPLSFDFFRRFRRLDADITHLHFPYPPGEIARLLRGGPGRLVITYHSDVVRQRHILRFYAPLLKRVLQQADRIVVTSQAYANSSRHLQPFREKCEVIPLGIDVAHFEKDCGQGVELRRRFQPPLTLFVGHLRYYKGLDCLLQAMNGFAGQLLVVGTGPAQEEYRRMAAELAVSSRVHFLGEVSDQELPAYYRAADVFVLPSTHRSEAFGIVQLEAMAAGVPVVSTELGTGTSVVNRYGETGFVVPPRDPVALAGAIQSLLDNPERRRCMGEAGRKRVRAEFSKEVMLDRTVELYRRVLQQ